MVVNKTIIDGMKKESRIPRNIMFFGYILVVLTFVYMYVNNKSFCDKEVITMFLACFMVGTIGLYGWLYAVKYRVEFNDKEICLTTLFVKVELNICDIEKYTCIRYKKSVFYQFNLFAKGKKVLVNTRHKKELEDILRYNHIEQIA